MHSSPTTTRLDAGQRLCAHVLNSSELLAWKMEVDVMLGRNGDSVAGCGTEAPVAHSGDDSFVDPMPEPLQEPLANHGPALVDCDFNDHVPLKSVRQFPFGDARIGEYDGQGRLHFIALGRAVE